MDELCFEAVYEIALGALLPAGAVASIGSFVMQLRQQREQDDERSL